MVRRRGGQQRTSHPPRLELQPYRALSGEPEDLPLNRDLQRLLAQAPLTPYLLVAIGICIGLNMLDGFDILAMSFAASGIKADWHLLDSQLGALLSAGLVGMGLGSLTLGPCADRSGRRIIILLSVALAGLGMLSSAAARGYLDLLVLRVLTGVGIGGPIASVAVVVSEYAPDRWRGTALATMPPGIPSVRRSAVCLPRTPFRVTDGVQRSLSAAQCPFCCCCSPGVGYRSRSIFCSLAALGPRCNELTHCSRRCDNPQSQ